MKPKLPKEDDHTPSARLTRSLATFVRSAVRCPRCGGQTLSQWLDGELIGHACQSCRWTEGKKR